MKRPEESAPPSPETTGADLLVKALIDEEVEVVFGYPGGAVLPIYDSIFKQNRLRHILVRHEQAAVHAAEGYARSTGKVGVVLVTSGPGATNAVTGLTDALMDSVPIVCLTGQVPTHLIGNDAFQEADTTGITRPCTKHNYLVKSVEALSRTVHEAFYVARSGRPGPVVIDLPKDVLMNKHEYAAPKKPVQHKSYRPQVKPDPKKIEQAVDLLAKAKRPIFYVGGGVVNAGPKASKLLTQFVRATGFPITMMSTPLESQAVQAVRQGSNHSLALDKVPPRLRAGVQALLFAVLREWGRTQALRQHLVQRQPAPAVDALLCVGLALLALAMVGFALASAAAALMVVGGHLLDRQEVPRPLIDMHRPGKTGGWRR